MNEPEQRERDTRSVESGSAESTTVRDAPFPHVDIPKEATEGRNADHVPQVPEGPRRGPLGPTAPRSFSRERRQWERGSGGHNR